MTVNTFSRLGSANAYDNTVANLTTRQNNLSNLQEVMSSGKKINRPSDDPTGAAQAERALNRLARIATDQRALDAQRNSISSAESTLATVTDTLQQFRDLVVNAGSGSYSSADRKTITNQLIGLRDNLLTLANTQDSNGQPLFAALGSALKPFVAPAASGLDYTFSGLPGSSAAGTYAIPGALDGDSAFMLQPSRDAGFNVTVAGAAPSSNLTTGPITMSNSALVDGSSFSINVTGFAAGNVSYDITRTLPATVPPTVPLPAPVTTAGTATWTKSGGFTVTDVPAGNGMPGLSLNVTGTPTVGDTLSVTPNSSMFSTLDHAITDITAATSSAAANQAVTQALHNIDLSLARVSAIRGQAGDLLNRADSITSTNDKRSIEQEANRSTAEDVDMIKAVSDFQKQQTGYSAALQSYAQIQKLSLFNFIS
jgi:flagellar hook-associated protein 3 FlgL